MSYRCIIFDMDGTLTNTNRLIFDSFNHIAKLYRGRTYSDEEIIGMFGPPEEVALRAIVPEEDMDEVMVKYLDCYRSNHRAVAGLHPGIAELLQKLNDDGRIVCLFTGKGTHTTRISLEECGVQALFACVVTGNDVTEYKPSGEGIRKILETVRCSPLETIMIGDSVADALAARDAGVHIASVIWDSYGKDDVLALNPDYVFRTVEELSALLLEPTTRIQPFNDSAIQQG